MAPTLYMTQRSPPVRAVLMTAKSIGLDLDFKEINLDRGDHTAPEFVKINPQHTIPTLVDEDGYILWDSHAIMPYILTKYGQNDSLYPRDSKKRAIVDQRLHFNSGVLWAISIRILKPIVFQGSKTIDQSNINALNEAYGFLESFLEGRLWVAGDSVTIADYSLIATVSSMDAVVKVDPSKFPNIIAWLKRAQSLPVYEVNKPGLAEFASFIQSRLK